MMARLESARACLPPLLNLAHVEIWRTGRSSGRELQRFDPPPGEHIEASGRGIAVTIAIRAYPRDG